MKYGDLDKCHICDNDRMLGRLEEIDGVTVWVCRDCSYKRHDYALYTAWLESSKEWLHRP